MEVSTKLTRSKVENQNEDQQDCSRSSGNFNRIWNGSFTIDLPNVDR